MVAGFFPVAGVLDDFLTFEGFDEGLCDPDVVEAASPV